MTTLIIPIFNAKNIISKDFLETIKQYATFLDQVIVIDDGSCDDSASLFDGIDVDIVSNKKNLGFAKSVNIGLSMNKSKYVCILNQDCLIPSDWIRNAESFLDDNQKTAAVSGLILNKKGQIDTAGHMLWSDWVCTERFSGMPGKKICQAEEVFGLSATATVYRYAALKQAAVETEFFDESFGTYLEDVDLNIRLRHLDWESWIIPGDPAIHERGSTGVRHILKVRKKGTSNYLKIVFKNLSDNERMSASLFCAISFFWGFLKDPLAATFNPGDSTRLNIWREVIQNRRVCPEDKMKKWICGFRLNPFRRKG
ncbi:hypothetical protein CL645_05125 [bacterium]|nr:hypothetical protein [bacterium]MBD62212.1 hypothetical protein [bacterium]|tara:strand:- start:10866 stop:11801 length:936 start_codon:yes stop_codon:yes gene_type:complete